jgi:hypothetical protein
MRARPTRVARRHRGSTESSGRIVCLHWTRTPAQVATTPMALSPDGGDFVIRVFVLG